ncbi:MAG: YvcK family protein [Planctomycetes bacterium]|nr:YvcK family protein [Planctomycetota bacterium]
MNERTDEQVNPPPPSHGTPSFSERLRRVNGRTAPRIVCIGGGTGQSQLLRGLSRYPLDITAIVGVTDNGGHSGLLRRDFGIPQVGDIRNCLAALAPDSSLFTRLMRYRFSEGSLDGASLGNLIVVAMIRMGGSLSAAIETLARDLGARHRILPVSDESAHICAELADGRTVHGEWEIIRRRPRSPIARMFLKPSIRCLPDCAKALAQADVIVFCPGSLLTGIVSALLTNGIQGAIRRSRALKVQISNIMTQPGQTDGFSAGDHLRTLAHYLGTEPDVFVLNTGRPPKRLLDLYRKDGSVPVRADVRPKAGLRVIARNLLEPRGLDVLTLYARHGKGLTQGPHFIRHDPDKLAAILWELALKTRRPSRERNSSPVR